MEDVAKVEFTGLAVVDAQLRKPAAIVLAADRPAGNRLRKRGDIGLGVAAVDAERVQLEDFARQVFVDVRPCGPLPRRADEARGLRVRPDGRLVVEIQQHGRMLLDGQQQVREVPVTCGRMASRSIAPARPSTAILSIDTAKWLLQNCVRRSRNGRSVVTECEKRANASSMYTGR